MQPLSIQHKGYNLVRVPERMAKEPTYAVDLDGDGKVTRTDYGEPQAYQGGGYSWPDECEVIDGPTLTHRELTTLARQHKDQEVIPEEALPADFAAVCKDTLIDANQFGFTDQMGLHIQGNTARLVVF